MTIKRQYSLPNCKLVLEGVGEEDSSGIASVARPPLSVLVNAECHLTGYEKPLTGGREFVESLVAAVSNYAQEYLSGVRHPVERSGKSGLVQLQKIDEDLHRLTVHPHEPQDSGSTHGSTAPTQIDLQTVQLFDLVEAVDQLCADTQTLPDLSLKLAPVSKRNVVSQEPVAKRAIPATIGVSGLAVAAGLLFLIPLPETRRPEPTPTGATQESPNTSSAPASPPTPIGADPPDAPSASPVAALGTTTTSPSPTETDSPSATESPSPIASPSAIASPDATSSAESSSDGDLASILNSAPEITDPAQLEQLMQQLRSKLDESWKTRPSFAEDLVYRVGVAENGDILGFRYVNDAAVNNVDETPLLDLRYNPTSAANQEAIAQFRVVFTPSGVVEVSPWHGRVTDTNPSP